VKEFINKRDKRVA